jgi:hypothetical protein
MRYATGSTIIPFYVAIIILFVFTAIHKLIHKKGTEIMGWDSVIVGLT